jgi:hypothetical protein
MNNTPQPKPIAVGDQVRWTQISIQGSYTNLTLRQGTLIAIEGNTATVQPLNKRSKTVQVRIEQLEAERKETIITSTVNAMLGKDEDK